MSSLETQIKKGVYMPIDACVCERKQCANTSIHILVIFYIYLAAYYHILPDIYFGTLL